MQDREGNNPGSCSLIVERIQERPLLRYDDDGLEFSGQLPDCIEQSVFAAVAAGGGCQKDYLCLLHAFAGQPVCTPDNCIAKFAETFVY